jgi:hypothetical protein
VAALELRREITLKCHAEDELQDVRRGEARELDRIIVPLGPSAERSSCHVQKSKLAAREERGKSLHLCSI